MKCFIDLYREKLFLQAPVLHSRVKTNQCQVFYRAQTCNNVWPLGGSVNKLWTQHWRAISFQRGTELFFSDKRVPLWADTANSCLFTLLAVASLGQHHHPLGVLFLFDGFGDNENSDVGVYLCIYLLYVCIYIYIYCIYCIDCHFHSLLYLIFTIIDCCLQTPS